jgi:hypothetical protein
MAKSNPITVDKNKIIKYNCNYEIVARWEMKCQKRRNY